MFFLEIMLAPAFLLLLNGMPVHMYSTKKVETLSAMSSPIIQNNESSSLRLNRSLSQLIDGSNLPLSVYSRTKRQGMCNMTTDKLSELKQLLNDHLSQIQVEWETCRQMSIDSIPCESWLKIMRCSTNHLREELTRKMSEGKPLSYPERWEATVKEILFRLEEMRVMWQSSSTNNVDIDNIRADLKGIEEVLSEIQTAVQQKIINDCVQELSRGNYEKAVNHFKKVGLNYVLTEITTKAFKEYGKMNNIKNIIDFAKELSNCGKTSIVYISLFYLIEEENKLNDPEIVIFHHEIGLCMKNTSIVSSLKNSATQVFISWGNNIRNDEYKNFIEFINKYYLYVRDFYADIIEKAYDGNKNNARSILNFITETPYIEDEILALNPLFDVINKNNDLDIPEILMVAHRLKTVMEMTNYPTVRDANRNIADTLKNKFNNNIRRIIWNGDDCTIKNNHRQEYLYAAGNGWVFDSTRRKVFTWRPGTTIIQGGWTIEAEKGGEHFSIKNRVHSEYLYAASDNYARDPERRTIFTWRPGDKVIQGDWYLLPVNGGEYFAFKNKAHREYLFSPDDPWALDSDRRNVFTLRSSSSYISREMKWEISC